MAGNACLTRFRTVFCTSSFRLIVVGCFRTSSDAVSNFEVDFARQISSLVAVFCEPDGDGSKVSMGLGLFYFRPTGWFLGMGVRDL